MVQIVQMTKEEKIAMYMKCTKKQLAEMLVASNEVVDSLTPIIKYSDSASAFNTNQVTSITGMKNACFTLTSNVR